MVQTLAVVMTMVILMPKLEPQVWEVRIGTPVTNLLTLIFLQQGYKDTLPPLPSLTFIDKVYAFSYTVTLVTFGLSIWMLRRTNQAHLIHDPKQLNAPAPQPGLASQISKAPQKRSICSRVPKLTRREPSIRGLPAIERTRIPASRRA